MAENFRELVDETLPTTEAEIRQEFDKLVAEEGFITNTSQVSPFWRLVTAVAVKPVKWLTDYLIEGVLPNLFVKTATDKWLQIQAWQIGLDFKPATQAKGFITFTKQDPSMTVRIEAGTVVQTERINDKVYRLSVDETTLIASGEKSAKVRCTAIETGAAYNLAAGYYRILPEGVAGIAKVENEEDWLIQLGADRETNEELRERYRAKFSSVGKHHIDSVYKSIIAELAGVSVERIYILHDAPRGPGTANVYLLLDSGINAQPFLDAINRHLNESGYHGHGDDVRAFKMPESSHNVALTLYFRARDGLTTSKKEQIKHKTEQMIRAAFRENSDFAVTKVLPYSRFSFSKLGEEIHQQMPEIRSIVWGQGDILNGLSIPRLANLTIEISD